MKENVKIYLRAAIVLSSIGAVSAGVIGAVNLITKDRIAQNEVNATNKALADIYENASFVEDSEFEKQEGVQMDNFKVNLLSRYEAKKEEELLGFVYKTSGKNSYGEIVMLVGINDQGIGRISFVSDTQTYGSTLEDEYLYKYNNNKRELDDVSCGATYGAKLVKDMAKAAENDYLSRKEGK